jgi:hypothetical protein
MAVPKDVANRQRALHHQTFGDERDHVPTLQADATLHHTETPVIPIRGALDLNPGRRKRIHAGRCDRFDHLRRVITTHLKIRHLRHRGRSNGQIEVERRPEKILRRRKDMEQGKDHGRQKNYFS